jgi:hypothetical protein
MRHSSELPANAIIANDVGIKTRVREFTREICGDSSVERSGLREHASELEIAVSYILKLDPKCLPSSTAVTIFETDPISSISSTISSYLFLSFLLISSLTFGGIHRSPSAF